MATAIMTSPHRRRRAQLACLAVTLIGTLIVAELVVPWAGLVPPRRETGWRPHPRWRHWHPTNTTISFKVLREGTWQTVRFNEHGMRDSSPRARSKPPNVLRLAVLGDSFVEAMQVAEDDALCRRLECYLRASLSREVEVLNFGCSGFSSLTEWALLRNLALDFEPDLVVCLHHFSDLTEDWSAQRFAQWEDDEVVCVRASLSEAEASIYRVLETSALYRGARQTLRRDLEGRCAWGRREEHPSLKTSHDAILHVPFTEDDEEAWSLSLAAVSGMAKTCAQRGLPFVLAIVPLGPQVEPVTPQIAREAGCRWLADGRRLQGCLYQSRIVKHCQHENIEVLDLLPGFLAANHAGEPRFFWRRDQHWSEAGHDLAARLLADTCVAICRRHE
jgi:hypothetical protein